MTRALVLLCMAIILPLVRCHKIHEHMTREEMLSVFYTGHESVPPYEVVPVLHTVHKRSVDAKPQIHLKAFGKDIRLSLKPTEGLLTVNSLPMWTVTRNTSQPDGLHYERLKNVDVDIGDIYQDTENMASILLHQDTNGKVRVDGTIGSELIIRPLPERVLQEIVSKTPALHEPELLPNVTSSEDLERTSHHIVFKKVDQPIGDKYNDFSLMEPDHLAKRYRIKRSINSRSRREAPYVIYPEILCIVDYDGYRLHGGDNVQIKRYFVSFWNGVDLRYKLLKGPKIRISIAGIIISRGRDATPYLERNRVGRDAIDSAAALTDMGKYLFRERRLPVYDIAVAVTKLDMCRRQYANDVCNRGTAGFAYVGGACVVNKRLEKVNSVAIIEDTGGFSGIIVAAHEVGHLLGAVHDGSPPPSYLGGPGAEKCRWEDGYIMSDLRHTEKGFKWSHCSVSSFHHFLNGDTATCLYNAPHEDEALPRVLPGKLLSLDAQCRKDRGTSACFKDDRVCAQLFCFDAGSGYCVAYRPAAEGSPCGDGQYCLNGKCVAEHENIIPDYTQNIPTYVRRDSIFNSAAHRPIFAHYNNTDYRYPWEATQSMPLSSVTPTTTTTTTTTIRTSTYPYKHFTNPFATTVSKYTRTFINNLYTNQYKTKYNNNNNNNSNSNSNSDSGTGGSISTTTKKSFNFFNSYYTVSTTPKVTYGPKVSPFKYKSVSLSTTTKGYQNGLRSNGRETEAGECTDVGSDCAEVIDRLRTWLCHLQSVKSRCCASLKTICTD
ncbi:A disintegrin and metalloproteinase with thrombospondin motifs 18 isoform X1 [Monomorium pharaonis]|uniref:A disintegrin and metalloproteinase with thrombospondin motifs 18 isoform X1 n=1 Tax=Monomorium pharaonis TaxID=307658 RepID=UPI00063F0842|nr:A disintegrin and metalloproteinase with thrombospondin motifs 18 isoform X1 [Monomorium pharaonis]XP_012535501.1 A disintegrin and metalloproteinase with thrombospondin motifs 18 isoform X1 [Monomorium pharaonis]XP_012535502.1 A disintegrin and metalloproteinase with thrombospondin motifs 18 isoform X1 [Monomorium pharaonis]XP_036146139.1 A disintegrin and metalloproteinase with thrombospondin motifs 18 isoform X1 [Monomorium pharaonis]